MSRLILWSVATDWRAGQEIYEVLTWDTEADDYTVQPGMDRWYYGFAGLREAIRLLRHFGYMGCKGDPSSSVTCMGKEWGSGVAERRAKMWQERLKTPAETFT